ncbi:Senescence-associated carboxylesterase 101 [Glycine max]|nr:Senescence-associated carboxylesterase 101 [Glycine max]
MRMVEPLAIAQYYREGGKDYMKERSKHFVWLEDLLLKEQKQKDTGNSNDTNKKNVEIILTYDSCFWAHVEEALLLCKQLVNVQYSVTEKEEATRKLLELEKFSSGFELASSVTSSVLLHRSWNVITSRYAGIVTNVGEGVSWKVYREPGSDLTIIAFEVKLDFSNLQAGLVSSNTLRENNFHHFEFLCTKKDPFFSVNKTAISLFSENYEKLDQLKSEINSSTKLIVTGHGLGGAVASLFTISLLNSIGSGKNRPLCITFGSPLIGDKKLQQAISRSSNWNSCFLHVVSLKDPLPTLFITNYSSSPAVLTPETSGYMPFGTFFLCSDANSTCFENPDSILELLIAMGSIHTQNQGFQSSDYGNIVEKLNDKVICKFFSTRVENMAHAGSALESSISLQLQALALTPHLQQQNIDTNTLETKIKIQEQKFILHRRIKNFDPAKKLNVVKLCMSQLEWYKKETKNQRIGYYDSYKNMNSPWDYDVIQFHKRLTNYWEKMVEEVEMKPQKEGAAFRTRWLYAGTNYRRMVEPLAVAQYYREGGIDYVTQNRSKHFVRLEEWLNEGTKKATSDLSSTSKKNVEALLTFDSCFWAHVEEALLSCKELKVVREKEETLKKLVIFEEYVYGLVKNYAVSPEIFLAQSSYMCWWNEYKAIKGTFYNSALSNFMSDARKREHFPRYSSSSSVKKHHDPICTICDSGSRFNSGIEFASFVTSSHVLLHRSWIVTSSYHEDTCSKKKEGEGLSWKVHKRPDSDLTIIAFEATLDYSDFQADLVPSYAPTEEKILHFDLLCDEINPIFSVNNTTISLFHKNHCRLDQLKSMDFITLHQSNSVLEGSISLQLRALALTPHMQRNVLSNPFKKLNQMEEGPEWYKQQHHQNIDMKALVTTLEKRENKFIVHKRVKLDPSNKLNKMKIDMAQLACYMVYCKKQEAKIRPQKASEAFCQSWIQVGTGYRRMVEPLAIAQYYRDEGKDYVTENRPEHFVLLEKWHRKEMTKGNASN